MDCSFIILVLIRFAKIKLIRTSYAVHEQSNVFAFLFSVGIIGGIIGYLGSKGYFTRKSICKKYCYLYNKYSEEKYEDVLTADNVKQEYRIRNYYENYYLGNDYKNAPNLIIPENVFGIKLLR